MAGYVRDSKVNDGPGFLAAGIVELDPLECFQSLFDKTTNGNPP
jgi:hypothetical protein